MIKQTVLELKDTEELFSLVPSKEKLITETKNFADRFSEKETKKKTVCIKNDMRGSIDSFVLQKDEELGDLRCASFLTPSAILIGTSKG